LNTLTVLNKELRSYFGSPFAYIIMAAFLVLGGILFAGAATDPNGPQAASMDGFFSPLPVLLLLIAPILSMRLLADEQRSGTLELLLTAPVGDGAVVVGKYLASFLLYLAMLALSLVFGLLLSFFGNPAWGVILSSYLGAALVGAACLAIGLFASSLSANQAVAAFIALTITLVLWLAERVALFVDNPNIRSFISQMALFTHYGSFTQGVINTKDVFYYLSITVVFVFMAVQSLQSRRWR